MSKLDPTQFLDYRLYLASLYERRKREDDGYSYKRFADDLGFGPTTVMHQIVRGTRPLTVKAAAKVVKALELTGVERRYFLALVEYGNTKDARRRDELFDEMLLLKEKSLPDELDKDTLAYFSEWYHPVVRELCGTPGFKSDPAWIAGRVVPRLRPEQVVESLALLQRLGLIRFDDENGRHVQTDKRVQTGHRVKGLALVRYHQQMIEHGKQALTRIEGKRRDVSAVTVNIAPEAVERLKAKIHALQLEILDAAEKAPGDEVYQINVQLFPFTED